MNKTRPDVIEILEMEKQYHADQIRRINVAIKALSGSVTIEKTAHQEVPSQKPTKSIQWTEEIKKIFDNNDIFSIEQTRDKLVEKGIVEAMSEKGRNSMYSTFSRLKKTGYLEQVEYGKYRKKAKENLKHEPRTFTRRLRTEKNESSEPIVDSELSN